ncbi:serine hydroxymethyltransferase [Actinomadura sp. J1-007]|nr:serine hydroxymethyltransferase [Actinomadura sp. J1-007]
MVMGSTHFGNDVSEVDGELHRILSQEYDNQRRRLSLIASENLVSQAVRQALSGVFTNTQLEGYPGERYLRGSDLADTIEQIAIERARGLFGCAHANVQPHSGSQMNHAVIVGLLKPGDRILSMDTAAGGHLTHGAPSNLTGRLFSIARYGVDPETGTLDYEEIRRAALEHRPQLIIAGGSSYPRRIDFSRFRAIADEVGSLFLVDMSHFSGLVATGLHPSPLGFADVVTSTTYKSLRGPRGAIILTNRDDLTRRIDSAVTPGVQDGVQTHHIAAKAICFKEAAGEEFKDYAAQGVKNAQVLGRTLTDRGYRIVSGGSDLPFALVDLREAGITGADAAAHLEEAGIICNMNQVPFDPRGPKKTSGVRLGVNAATSRGLRDAEFREVGDLIADILDAARTGAPPGGEAATSVRKRIERICTSFPFYDHPLGI